MRRLRAPGALVLAAGVAAGALLGAQLVAAEEPSPPALVTGAFESSTGQVSGGAFGLTTSAGALTSGRLSGGAVAVEPGVVATADACPGVAGTAARQGCDVGVDATAALHLVDTASRTCGTRQVKPASCTRPLAAAAVKAWSRAALDGVVLPATGTQPQVTLSRTPSKEHYARLFASPVADAAARVTALGCVTTTAGCTAGSTTVDDLLVLVRWTAPDGTVVHSGKVVDGDDGASAVTVTATFVERREKDGRVTYTGD